MRGKSNPIGKQTINRLYKYIELHYHFNIMLQIIQGGTIRGGDLLVTNVGYHYMRKADKRPGRSKRWCSTNRNRQCKATVTEELGTFNPGLQLHICQTQPRK